MSYAIDSTPSHWPRMKVKHLVSLQSGDAIPGELIKDEGEYPVYGGNGLRGYTAETNREGDRVLIGRQGALCGNINYASGQFWATEHAIVATPKVGLEAMWLGETLRAMGLNQYSQSAAQPGIAVEVVGNLAIAVPPLKEQRKITAQLQRCFTPLDGLIAAKRGLLDFLAEKRRALITHTVTQGLNSDAPLRDSGIPWLGEIPAHWTIKRLKFLAEIHGGLTLGKSYGMQSLFEYPYLRVANVQDGYLDLTSVHTVMVPADEASSNLLQHGDLLMNEGGDIDKLGRGCVWRSEIVNCLHQNHVFCVRPKAIQAEWLDLWTTTETAKQYFSTRAKRSTNLASISATNVGELAVPLPPLSEQMEIRLYLTQQMGKIDGIAESTKRAIDLLQERRAALISAAVSGQLDLTARERMPIAELA